MKTDSKFRSDFQASTYRWQRGASSRFLRFGLVLTSLALGACDGKDACQAGTQGCACGASSSCDAGLSCNSDSKCVNPAEDNGARPQNPVCYTPCKASFTDADGQYVACSADGLMQRCLDDARCVNGSCIPNPKAPVAPAPVSSANGGASGAMAMAAPPRNPPGTCEKNIDCPDFQACIDGHCYSNCEADNDCPTDKGCYRKVCRARCEDSKNSCPDTTYCSLVDGQAGFCLPQQAPAEAEHAATATPAPVQGTFEVSETVFKFSNTTLNQSFTIVNDAPTAIEFVVSKMDHTEYKPEGQVEISENPLPWLKMGPKGATQKVNSFKVLVEGSRGQAVIELENEPDGIPPKWDGTLKVTSKDLGERSLRLSFAQGADGRWAGTISYFSQFGDTNLDSWAKSRDDQDLLGKVGNAFVQRWAALRYGRISMDEFDATLTATTTGSWAWPSVKAICPTAACYLYTNPDGYGRYSDSLDDQPVPTGVAQLPLALDLREVDAKHFSGRIVSSEALQYAGDPAVTLDFATAPSDCEGVNSTACLAFLNGVEANVVVGGRFATTSSNHNCSGMPGYALKPSPWLIPGFVAGTETDQATHSPYTYECRDQAQPFGTSDQTLLALNASLAGSNPIKDGSSRKRKLQLVDGLLVNQSKLYLLLKETFDANYLGADMDAAFSAYSVAVLHRANAQLSDDSFQGVLQNDVRAQGDNLGPAIACSNDLVQKALGPGATLGASTADDLAGTLLDGHKPSAAPHPLDPADVHYLCHDNGLLDQGKNPAAPTPCPVGSNVTYFTGVTADMTSLDCQSDGTCQTALDGWQGNRSQQFAVVVVACDSTDEVLCEKDRTNLRSHKLFYSPADPAAVFAPLIDSINSAFRYKTEFANREGRNIGFAPQICVPNSSTVPYCYDPPAIEELRERVDCLNYLFRASAAKNRSFSLLPATRARLFTFLERAYSYQSVRDPLLPTPVTHDGFEKLNAELLIMLGDEAYTGAFKSRFDLAQSSLVSFEGSKLEAGGIDLGGVAGYEMYTLYQATQYYQAVLDRFFALGSFVWSSVNGDPKDNFVQQEMIVSYLDRVMRASTQKSRAWSEVAKRYQSFARADLARFVIQRAFAAAYVESVSLSRLMQTLVAKVTPEQRAQIRQAVEHGALSYQSAFAAMQEQYASISDQTGYFGFSPDYVPFPTTESNGPNAFQVLLGVAKQASAVAAQKEDAAISADKGFETDAKSFQSELANIRNTYEDQLGAVCGTFQGTDNAIHPAIAAYAYLDPKARALGDPCGLMGNGDLFQAIGTSELVRLDIDAAALAFDNVLAEITNETTRASAVCKSVQDLADYQYETAGAVNTLQADIARTRKSISDMKLGLEIVQQVTNLISCVAGPGGSDCPSKAAAAAFWGMASSMVSLQASAAEDEILKQQDEIAALEREGIKHKATQECEQQKANSDATIASLWLKTKEVRLQALKAGYQLKLALGTVQKLRNQASHLLAEEAEAQQLSINVQAAKNDPNVRIYKNDAILNADRTFEDAIRATYQATRVFEYYTSQSYSHKGDLSLVRLVSRGDLNLEAYLSDLESAYATFAEKFGHQDLRVDILSVRDDVLQIPRIAQTGAAISDSERVALFRTALTDTRLLDGHGYLTIPFSTSLARLSPITRNHKIAYVEAEILGSRVGDTTGRIYLRQAGTGAVTGLDDNKSYYRFPERTAVINTFFNGVRSSPAEVYRDENLRDRPYVNTRWEFVLNQRDEMANQDIELPTLTDIRLYVYYNDFVGQP